MKTKIAILNSIIAASLFTVRAQTLSISQTETKICVTASGLNPDHSYWFEANRDLSTTNWTHAVPVSGVTNFTFTIPKEYTVYYGYPVLFYRTEDVTP